MPEPSARAAELTADALQTLASAQPVLTPQASLVWTAVVDIDAREDLGPSSHGERFIVAIRGGQFWGGPGHDALRGIVRTGGADRQLCVGPAFGRAAAGHQRQAFAVEWRLALQAREAGDPDRAYVHLERAHII